MPIKLGEGSFGANPPPGFEWEMGKNAASIKFVKDADAFIEGFLIGLEATGKTDQTPINKLREAIENIKSGKLVLQNWISPGEYLRQNQP